MIFLAITLANIIWILYSMTEGMQEAFFNYYRNKSRRAPRFNPRYICNLQRLLVLLSTGLILVYITGYYGILLMLAQVLMFKYFHKLSYNVVTRKLVEEPKIIVEEPIKVKEPLLIGVTIQLFIYLFLM